MKLNNNVLKGLFAFWVVLVLFFYGKLYILPKILDLQSK